MSSWRQNKRYVRYKDEVVGVLDTDSVGTYFRLRLIGSDGFVDVYENRVHNVRHVLPATGCYFKAGCYVRSSIATGDAPTAFASVDIAELTVLHRAAASAGRCGWQAGSPGSGREPSVVRDESGHLIALGYAIGVDS